MSGNFFIKIFIKNCKTHSLSQPNKPLHCAEEFRGTSQFKCASMQVHRCPSWDRMCLDSICQDHPSPVLLWFFMSASFSVSSPPWLLGPVSEASFPLLRVSLHLTTSWWSHMKGILDSRASPLPPVRHHPDLLQSGIEECAKRGQSRT